jgi:hypothetical protein
LCTDDKIALFSVSNILAPWEVAYEDPTKRLPMEQMDSSSKELLEDGRKVGA